MENFQKNGASPHDMMTFLLPGPVLEHMVLMRNTKNIICENKFPLSGTGKKLLIGFLLVLNLFSFSGYAGIRLSKQQEATKTELIFTDASSIKQRYFLKWTIKSHNTSNHPSRQHFTLHVTTLNAVLLYNRLVKTQISCRSKQFFSFRQRPVVFQIKSIPPSSDEDLYHSTRG
jgi:hypothetical protein